MARRKRKLNAEINVVPYIDVMLVLLIIFMITAPMMTRGIKVDLPKTGSEAMPPTQQKPIILSVDKQGLYYLNLGAKQSAPATEEEIMQKVSAVLRRDPKTNVVVNADTAVQYGVVVKGMRILQRAGAEQINFLTGPDVKAPK